MKRQNLELAELVNILKSKSNYFAHDQNEVLFVKQCPLTAKGLLFYNVYLFLVSLYRIRFFIEIYNRCFKYDCRICAFGNLIIPYWKVI